jgi:hypothetical protein
VLGAWERLVAYNLRLQRFQQGKLLGFLCYRVVASVDGFRTFLYSSSLMQSLFTVKAWPRLSQTTRKSDVQMSHVNMCMYIYTMHAYI